MTEEAAVYESLFFNLTLLGFAEYHKLLLEKYPKDFQFEFSEYAPLDDVVVE